MYSEYAVGEVCTLVLTVKNMITVILEYRSRKKKIVYSREIVKIITDTDTNPKYMRGAKIHKAHKRRGITNAFAS